LAAAAASTAARRPHWVELEWLTLHRFPLTLLLGGEDSENLGLQLFSALFHVASIRRSALTTLATLTTLLPANLSAALATLTATNATLARCGLRTVSLQNGPDILDLLLAQANSLSDIWPGEGRRTLELQFELLEPRVLTVIQNRLDFGVHFLSIHHSARSTLTPLSTLASLATLALLATTYLTTTLALLTASLTTAQATLTWSTLRRTRHKFTNFRNLILGEFEFSLDIRTVQKHHSSSALHAHHLATWTARAPLPGAALTWPTLTATRSALLRTGRSRQERSADHQCRGNRTERQNLEMLHLSSLLSDSDHTVCLVSYITQLE